MGYGLLEHTKGDVLKYIEVDGIVDVFCGILKRLETAKKIQGLKADCERHSIPESF